MTIETLLEIMSMLRDEQYGCPWDRQQSFATIAPHTLEEVYEVIDTIEAGDYLHLKAELGDLLFQIVFYAQLGKEQGLFEFNDIVEAIANKLLRRHPHVFPEAKMENFGKAEALSMEDIEGNWERIKAGERNADPAQREVKGNSSYTGILDDIPKALPALLRAGKLQKRAANEGFDWQDSSGVIDKLKEETEELQAAIRSGNEEDIEDEFGDLLFTCVNLARHLKKNPEFALRRANEKFETRFQEMESLINKAGKTPSELDIETLEEYWSLAKHRLSGG